MTRKAALIALLLALPACKQTEIEIKNDMPGTSIENVRWVTARESYAPETDQALAPGESTSAVGIWRDEDQNENGIIHFELVSNGRRVALVTDDQFEAVPGQLTTFSIGPSTRAHNPTAPASP